MNEELQIKIKNNMNHDNFLSSLACLNKDAIRLHEEKEDIRHAKELKKLS